MPIFRCCFMSDFFLIIIKKHTPSGIIKISIMHKIFNVLYKMVFFFYIQ